MATCRDQPNLLVQLADWRFFSVSRTISLAIRHSHSDWKDHHLGSGDCQRLCGCGVAHRIRRTLQIYLGYQRSISCSCPEDHPLPGVVFCAVLDWWTLHPKCPGKHLSKLSTHEKPFPSVGENEHQAIYRLGDFQHSHDPHIVYSA